MQKVKISDFAEVITGGTPSTSVDEYWDNGTIPWLQSGACQNCIIKECDMFITEEGLKNSAAKMMKPESVLIALTGATTGKVGYLTFEACANQSVTGIQPNDRYVPKYLYYYLMGIRQKILDDSYGGAQKHISQGYVKNLEVPLGTIEEQRTIVNAIEKVDAVISARKNELQLFDDLVKARFVEMFEQGKYDKVEFGSICVFLRNGANIKQTKGAGGYPITRIETLANDVFNVDRLGYADVNDLDKYHNYLLKKGDILISHINSVAYIGRAVQYRGQLDTPIIHGMNLLCARIIEGYNPTYIEFFFKTTMAKDYISTITKKAVNQASITTSDLKKMMIPAPPLSVQNEFDSFVQQVDKSKFAVQKALDKAQLLFASLMQQYFG